MDFSYSHSPPPSLAVLSELPLSDTQSICASLNKSLLFHPRVAEEAQNLLSVHDDERIELLANAIAQTNTDQMYAKSLLIMLARSIQLSLSSRVLKDKFQNAASNRPSQNVVPVPELLQGILDYNPTVFDTRSHGKDLFLSSSESAKQSSNIAELNYLLSFHLQLPPPPPLRPLNTLLSAIICILLLIYTYFVCY